MLTLTSLNRITLYLIFAIILFVIPSNKFAQDNKLELVNIQFVGNDNISDAVLETIIVSKESPGWLSKTLNAIGFGDEATFFDSTILVLDLNALQSFYYDNGYFESRFDFEFKVDKDDKEAEVSFIITEGKRSKINSLVLTGTEKLNPLLQKGVAELINIDSTDFYNKSSISNIRSELSSYLKDKGMMLAVIELPNVLIDTIANFVDITIDIFPGKIYNINEVRVEKTGEGENLVEDDLIEDIVNVKSGDRYNASKLRSSQERLYRTNLFNYALVSGIIADTLQNNVPLLVSTNVGLLNEFTPEIIVNNEDNVFNLGLSLGYTRKNFFGGARRFNITTSAASQDIFEFISKPVISDTSITGYADLRLQLDQPFLFGQPIYTRLENYLTLQKRRDQYNATIIGGKLSFNFELPRKVYFTSLSAYTNFEHTKYLYSYQYLFDAIYEFSRREIFGDNKPTLVENLELLFFSDSLANAYDGQSFNTNNSLIGVQLSANKTNSFLFPTEGYSVGINLENANLFPYLVSKMLNYNLKDPQYYRIRFTGTGFVSLSPRNTSTIGTKFTIGNIDAYRGSKFQIPFNQRYASGGSNSVRGWGARELVTGKADIDFDRLDPNAIEAALLRGEKLGGYFLVEGSFEWRQKFLNNLGSAIFLDYGNTLFAPEDFKFDKIAVAIGFGLRYYSEIVPLRLDFGFKFYDPNKPASFFNKNIWKDTFQFQIGIGEAF